MTVAIMALSVCKVCTNYHTIFYYIKEVNSFRQTLVDIILWSVNTDQTSSTFNTVKVQGQYHDQGHGVT